MIVLLSAYSCRPDRGSESQRGWHLSKSLADLGHDVYVVTDERSRQVVAPAKGELPQHLHFIFVNIPRWALAFPGQLGIYAQYLAWQWSAYRAARALVAEHEVDIVHHVTWGSLQLGTWMWRLDAPLILGPIGGGQVAPSQLREFYVGRWRNEAVRTVVTKYLTRFDVFAVLALRRARCVLVSNRETGDLAKALGADDVRYMPDIGLPIERLAAEIESTAGKTPLRLIWVGRLMPRKALPLALEAVRRASRQTDVRLTVVGYGPQADYLSHWIQVNEADAYVHSVGQVLWEDMPARYRDHHALLFTSLRDTAGDVLIEAMGHGLPIIALDHQGAAAFVPDSAACKIPIGDPAATVDELADAIVTLSKDTNKLQHMASNALAYAAQNTWDRRARRLFELYVAMS